jgi:hypothetical protein
MTKGQYSGLQKNITEIISYNAIVINPRKISIRNISSKVKTSTGNDQEIKALVIQYCSGSVKL